MQLTEARISKLQQMVEWQDEREKFLTNMLGKLSTRVEALEKGIEERLGMLHVGLNLHSLHVLLVMCRAKIHVV